MKIVGDDIIIQNEYLEESGKIGGFPACESVII